VVVTNPTWEIVASNVMSRLTSIIVEHSAIVKIHKYNGLHKGHHFILMATEVHGAPECHIDYFIGECAHFFHNRRSKGHLSLFFCIKFFKQLVNITLHSVLTSIIEKKIALACDVNSRHPLTIRSHDLHVGDIRRVVGEITPYHERD
jgi:hypothetical protein